MDFVSLLMLYWAELICLHIQQKIVLCQILYLQLELILDWTQKQTWVAELK